MKKNVLLIEDDRALNEAIKMKLEKAGYGVVSALTAEEAIPVLENQPIDFVWLDILLPGMNGLEFLRVIRQKPLLKDKKVAVVSVSGSYGTKEEARKWGIVDYIVKSEYKLNDIVDRIISQI
ncbi:MAG: response regulator [Candidatus Terrybacteria bacterium]|nr:response regulator [Candidatus Terrybacteria bacterium]